MISAIDLSHLQRCVDLAAKALASGDQPFGSILVSSHGDRLWEGHNEVSGGDATRHPEFAIARWAAANLSPDERRSATVYTSGEHCPMCAAAHGWVGLGRIVYAASCQQLVEWMQEVGASPRPVAPLPIRTLVPDAVVEGPVEQFAERLRLLHQQAHARDHRA